jgi:hypothetical protein
LDLSCRPPPFIAAAAFPVGSTLLRPSLLDLLSLWLDRRLYSWIHRCRGLPGRIRCYLFYSVTSATTLTGADACAATCLHGGAPQQSDERRRKKVIGLLVLFFSVVSPTAVARTSTPPEKRGIYYASPCLCSAPPRLRLPQHTGAIIYTECTPISVLAATLAPSRRCDCEGISTVGSYSSLIVCSAPVATAGTLEHMFLCVGRLAPLAH